MRLINGHGIKDTIASILSKTNLIESPPQYIGEMHAKDYNFMGPGTDLLAREIDGKQGIKNKKGINVNEPINKQDQAAKKHDYAYKSLNKKLKNNEIDEEQALNIAHKSDEEFIDDLKKIKNIDMTGVIASKAILLKKWLENKKILSQHVFTINEQKQGSGILSINDIEKKIISKHYYPDHMLRKEMKLIKDNKKGGFLPVLMPFLAPIITSLLVEVGAKALPEVIKYFTKKKQGSGIDANEAEKKIFDVLDDLDNKKQIELVYNAIKKFSD